MATESTLKMATSVVAPSSTMAGSTKEIDVDDISDIETVLLTLRKPTDLKKIINSIPKPMRAVPKNGLPIWYKLGLESKLPVPKMPHGKIVFSRGKMGEDIRRIGLGADSPAPTFDLTDPYCYTVSYDYVPVHDPHLAFYFRQKTALTRMKELGFATKDGRAVCSLKEFNVYRQYLYNRYMDRIHAEMKKIDEKAKDDLTLKRVEAEVKRRAHTFRQEEKAREHMEKYQQIFMDEAQEKKRRAREEKKKIQARMKYLTEYNEKKRHERIERIQEQERRIRQRVQAAAEMELKRKITMIRNWRTNEKRRQNRLAAEREAKIKKQEDDANEKWEKRVNSQNRKIQEENLLLRLYSDDLRAAAQRRMKRAEIHAYNTDLQLQSIRIANLRAIHGGQQKRKQLMRKMGTEFEKSKRGAKGMTPALAHQLANEAMSAAFSTDGDVLMTLGQARFKMDLETILPPPPLHILEEMLETAVVEFARRRVAVLLRDIERAIFNRAKEEYLRSARGLKSSARRRKVPAFSKALTAALAQQYGNARKQSIAFGEVVNIQADDYSDTDFKSVKDRPPTPVPSLTKLAEVTFTNKIEELPDPVANGASLPERRKLIEMVNTAARLLSRAVSQRVQNGLDLNNASVTLPRLRTEMEMGEAVEGLSEAVVNNRIQPDCGELRRAAEFLASRILKAINVEIKAEKLRQKSLSAGGGSAETENAQDFYTPGQTQSKVLMPQEEVSMAAVGSAGAVGSAMAVTPAAQTPATP